MTSCSSSDNSDDSTMDVENPALKVTVTASVIDEGNGINGVDDIIEYTISIQNTGDVTLSSISLVSSLTDFLNNSLELDAAPNFVSASLGSSIEFIQASEIATYNASFTITQSEVNADGFRYSLTVDAMTPQNSNLSDVSDNGDDSDGNLENDATEINIEFDPLIIAEYHSLDILSGEISHKYRFDSNGRISQVVNVNDNTIHTYNFDSENRLIKITENDSENMPLGSTEISYTSEGKILSVGERTFSYNPDLTNYVPVDGYTLPTNGNSFYIDDTSYYSTSLDIGFKYLVEDMTGQVFDICNQYSINFESSNIIFEGCFSDQHWYFSNNLLSYYGSFDSPKNPEYDTLINPLFQGSTNFANIVPFYNDYILFNKNFFSINNRIGLYYSIGEDPEHTEYVYDFNTLGLPVQSTVQYYFFAALENEYLYSKYYYQGDTIPD